MLLNPCYGSACNVFIEINNDITGFSFKLFYKKFNFNYFIKRIIIKSIKIYIVHN